MTLTRAFALHGEIDGMFALRVISCATAVWLIGAFTIWAFRRSLVAAVRHRIWSLSCLCALVIPMLLPILPQWRVGPPHSHAAVTSVHSFNSAPAPVPAVTTSRDERSYMAEVPELSESSPKSLSEERPAYSPSTGHDLVDRPKGNYEAAGTLNTKPRSTSKTWPSLPWSSILWISWLLPAVWLFFRQMASLRAARHLVGSGTVINGRGNDAASCLKQLSKRFGIFKLPLLVESTDILSPICVGLFHPCVLLPHSWREWTMPQLQAVLTHELAHVARRDVLWQMLARFASALYWFHPMAWLAARQMRLERELACDDWVLREGQPSTTYARWLLDVAAATGRMPHRAGAAGVAMAARGGLERRVAAILDPQRRRSPVSRRAAFVMALAAILLAIVIGVINPWASRAVAGDAPHPKPEAMPTTNDPLTRILHLAGRIEDEQGNPVAGVYVEACSGLTESQTRSDTQGRFALDLKDRRDRLRYIIARATTPDGTKQTFQMLYDPKGDGQITDAKASDVRLVLKPAREFPVTVKDHQGLPVADAWIAFSSAYQKAGEARTDAAGKTMLRVPADAAPMHVIATKSGLGLDYVLFWRKEEARTDPYRLAPDYAGPLAFVLDGTKSITVKVVDDQSRPLSGVKVLPWLFNKPKHGDSCNQGLAELGRMTDASGIATFDYIPANSSDPLVLWTRLDGFSSPRRCMYDPKKDKTALEATMLRQVRLTGRVLDDAGQSAAGATVRYFGDGYSDTPCYGTLETSADGTFDLQVDADKYYMLTADKGSLAAKPQMRTVRRESPAPVELALAPGTRIFGQANDEKGAPIPRASVSLILRATDSYLKLPADQRLAGGEEDRKSIAPSIARHFTANEKGVFEVYAAPGKYALTGYGPPSLVAEREVKVTGQELIEINLRPNEAYVALKSTPGRVVLRDKPQTGVPDVSLAVYSTTFMNFTAVSDKEGNFTIQHGKEDMYIHAVSDDKSLSGFSIVHATDGNVTIPLGPTASATGRLLDYEGTPLPGRTLRFGFRIGTPAKGYVDAFGQALKTAADGTFMIEGLVPGIEYHLSAGTQLNAVGEPQMWQSAGIVKADRAERIDVSDRNLPKPYMANQPKSWKEREAEAFAILDPIDKRLIEARERARAGGLHVLVVLGGPGQPGCDTFFEFASDPLQYDVRRALADYTVLAVNTLLTEPDALTWVEHAKIPWPAPAMTLQKGIVCRLLPPLTSVRLPGLQKRMSWNSRP